VGPGFALAAYPLTLLPGSWLSFGGLPTHKHTHLGPGLALAAYPLTPITTLGWDLSWWESYVHAAMFPGLAVHSWEYVAALFPGLCENSWEYVHACCFVPGIVREMLGIRTRCFVPGIVREFLGIFYARRSVLLFPGLLADSQECVVPGIGCNGRMTMTEFLGICTRIPGNCAFPKKSFNKSFNRGNLQEFPVIYRSRDW
jgi:hypothetical protein